MEPLHDELDMDSDQDYDDQNDDKKDDFAIETINEEESSV